MKIENNKKYANQIFDEIDLQESRVEQSGFEDCEFVGCNFFGTHFARCKFVDCDFKRSNLCLIKLDQSKFCETHFRDCKITGVNWTSLDWGGFTIASPIFFESCDLSFSVFDALELREFFMHSCKAHELDFSECDLEGSDFYRTDFLNARFFRTKLNNCNFVESINYYIDPIENSIDGARFSSPEVLSLLSPFNIKIDEG